MFRFLFVTIGFMGSIKAQALIELRQVEYRGTGCPQNSVSIQIDPSGKSFTVLYDQMDSRVDRVHNNDRKNCKVILKINKPKYLGYRIESADFRGFVNLDHGVTAVHEAKIQSGSVRGLQKLSTEFGLQTWVGPISQPFYTSTQRVIRGRYQDLFDCLPLGRRDSEIIIDTEVRLHHSGGNRYGQLTVDSADGRLAQRYNLAWTHCGQAVGDAIGALIGIR